MKIEDLIKIPWNKLHSVHTDPKNGNKIVSWRDKQGNLIKRFIYDKCGNGFTICLEHDDGLFWLYPVKKGFRIFESRIAIGRGKKTAEQNKQFFAENNFLRNT